MTRKDKALSKEAIAARARSWFVRLQDDDVSVEEIAEWQTWLNQNSAHQKAYVEIETLWTGVAGAALEDALRPTEEEIAADDYDGDIPISDWLARKQDTGEQSAAKMAPTTEPGNVRPLKGWRGVPRQGWMAIAASLAVMMTLTLLLFYGGPGDSPRDRELVASISTARAEQRTAKLFDGSQVDLGGASKVAVDFTGHDRIVHLTKGEAYFEVAHDPSKPFIVETPFGDVTAVGTAFNIRLAKDRFVVTVTKGKIDVAPRSNEEARPKKIRLVAGSALSLSNDHQADSGKIKPAVPISWRQGWLTYRAEPLRYVVADINRYSDVSIQLLDDQTAHLSYSGAMNLAAIDDWVAALPSVFPVEVTRGTGNVIQIGKKSS